MKKTILLTAVSMLLLSGCGEKTADTEKKEPEQRMLAVELTDKLNKDDYELAFTITGDPVFDGNTISIKHKGADSDVCIFDGKMLSEFIRAGDSTTMLFPEIECFQNTEFTEISGNAFISVGGADQFIESTEKDGVITEVYESPADSGSTPDRFTFEFDSETQTLKHLTRVSSDVTTEIEVSDFSWECEDISLPDLSGWADLSPGAVIQETTQLKFYLYYTMGIVESELNEFGYTYEEIANIKVKDRDAFYKELDKKAAEYEASHKDQK